MSGSGPSLAALHPAEARLVNVLLLSALAAFLVGVFGPLLTLEKFYVFSNTISLFSALVQLFRESQWLLFLVIGAFSVLLPLAKLVLLFSIWNLEPADSGGPRGRLDLLAHYGQWSMLDVFVVALMVVTIKLDAIAKVEIHYGVFAFTASVILTMLVTHWIVSRYAAHG